MISARLKPKHRRGRKRDTYIKKRYRNLTDLIQRFMESESAGAYVGRTLLAVIALGGVLAVGAVVPNIFSAFRGCGKKFNYSEKQVYRSFYYLRHKKLVKVVKQSNGRYLIKITKLGQKKLVEFAVDDMSIKVPEKWDNKWRAVVFDVPEKYKTARDSLRRKLRELGLYQFQRSIFLYPHPVEDEILFLSSIHEIERFVEIFTVESLLDDKPLKQFFSLSNE